MAANDFDPMDGLSAEDIAYLEGSKRAAARQYGAHGEDLARQKASAEHMRLTRLSLGLPAIDVASASEVSLNTTAPSSSAVISIMIANPEEGGQRTPHTEQYAPDWHVMKEMLTRYDGTWIVVRHEIPSQVESILGFFGKDGWDEPANSKQETFEVIVKKGKVFRTDI